MMMYTLSHLDHHNHHHRRHHSQHHRLKQAMMSTVIGLFTCPIHHLCLRDISNRFADCRALRYRWDPPRPLLRHPATRLMLCPVVRHHSIRIGGNPCLYREATINSVYRSGVLLRVSSCPWKRHPMGNPYHFRRSDQCPPGTPRTVQGNVSFQPTQQIVLELYRH